MDRGPPRRVLDCPADEAEGFGIKEFTDVVVTDDAQLFFRLHRSLMHFVNQRLGVVPDIGGPDEFAALPPEARLAVRKAFLDRLDLIESFVDENPAKFSADQLDIVSSWRHQKLSRKHPSPLLRGQPKTWACGIIRTIGMVNSLDDRRTQPHMKLTAIDKSLGVGESTGQVKSMEIRKMLKIGQFDRNWTLPSQIDDNPLVWMLEVNGFIMDMRDAPRDIQEIAFEKGLIPYIPADRETGSINDDDDDQRLQSGGVFKCRTAR